MIRLHLGVVCAESVEFESFTAEFAEDGRGERGEKPMLE